MANVALLSQHSTSKSLLDQPEVGCRGPEVKKTTDVGDLFHGALLTDGVLSRCSEAGSTSRSGSCRKHFRSSSSVDPITPAELAALLAAESGRVHPVIVVDCRTFLAFNTNHVFGAFNASCGDRFSRKRLTQGRATVADLVSGGPSTEEVRGPREAFRRLAESSASSGGLFVAYDDNTENLDLLQKSHPLRLLTTSLSDSGYRTKYLAGKRYYIVYAGVVVRYSFALITIS